MDDQSQLNNDEEESDSQREGKSNLPSRYNNLLQVSGHKNNQQHFMINSIQKTNNVLTTNKSKVSQQNQRSQNTIGSKGRQTVNNLNQVENGFSMLNGNFEQYGITDHQCLSCQVTNKGLAYNKLVCNQSIAYSANVPIQLSQNGNQDGLRKSDRSTYLRVELEILQKVANQTKNQNQQIFNPLAAAHNDILFLTISDDQNPQFLYFTTIEMSNFLEMQRIQNLHIEFNQFPEKLVELFNFCILNKQNQPVNADNSSRHSRQSIDEDVQNRFFCLMTTQSQQDDSQDVDQLAIVDIFENNQFRNLLHLKLNFQRASHEEARKWLAKKLLLQKRGNIELLQENEELKEKVEQDEELLQSMQYEFQKLKEDNDKMLELKEKEAKDALEQLDNQKNEEIQNLQEQYDSQIDLMRDNHNKDLQRLNEEVQRLQSQLQDVTRQKDQQLELSTSFRVKNDTLTNDYNSIQKEHSASLQQIEQLKNQIYSLDMKILELKLLNEQINQNNDAFKSQSDRLDQQLHQVNDNLEQSKLLVEQLKEKIILLQEQIKSQDKSLEILEDKLKKQSSKTEKYKSKIKEKKSDIKTLENEIALFNEKIQQNILTIEKDQQDKDGLEKQINDKNEQINALQTKLLECQETLKSNSAMIEFLNKSLNEAQKVSFRNIVNQKGQEINVTQTNNLKEGTIRSIIKERNENIQVQELSQVKTFVSPVQVDRSFQPKQAVQEVSRELNYQETYQPRQTLNLPLTEFYLNKQQNPNLQRTTLSTSNANMNPFSTQLQRDQIISNDRLRTRFDHTYGATNKNITGTIGYQNKYDVSPSRGTYVIPYEGQTNYEPFPIDRRSHAAQNNYTGSSTIQNYQGTFQRDINSYKNEEEIERRQGSQRDQQNQPSEHKSQISHRNQSVKFDESVTK
eukprot:403344684